MTNRQISRLSRIFSHISMVKSSDKSTLISVPTQSIGCTSTSITNVDSQFIGNIELKRNQMNTVDYEADSERLNPNQLYEEAAKLVEELGVNETPTDKTEFFPDDSANRRVEKENHRTTSPSTSVRMVIVGDVHDHWELQSDSTALEFLKPDLVLFTGDFGNENVELVRSVAAVNTPKAVILGNHDSWTTSKFSKKIKDGVQLQLECLGEQHVGYSNLDFPALKLSIVGGRPFSLGGNKLFRPKLLSARYGIRTMEESTERIHKAAVATPKGHCIVFLAHNGPTGLGCNKDDICGKDWVPEAGDNGDPDLAQAISLTKETTDNHIPLVVFGHMHKQTVDAGLRKMMVTADNTMYLNAAIVPRVTTLSSGSSLRAFTVVEFSSGQITKVAETWVSVNGDSASLEEEHFLFNSQIEPT